MSKYINLSGLKTLLEPLVHLINKKAERPDWNENDPSSPSYIEGRTHYISHENLNIFPEKIFIDSDGGFYDFLKNGFIKGESYTIIFDGISYNCIAKETPDGYEYIGNIEFPLMIWGEELPGTPTDEPFFMYSWTDEDLYGGILAVEGSHTIVVEGKVIHKLSKEYLPRSLITEGKGYNSIVANGLPAEYASGPYSFAEGCHEYNPNDGFNMLSGAHNSYSHAEGDRTVANGQASHSEGSSTFASGSSSHAEGHYNFSQGYSSHAEGINTKAQGEASHSEGINTIASGNYSHAEGYKTQANGESSHAEGDKTQANGQNCHAEGHLTFSDSVGSHAEGDRTLALGYGSHAEGDGRWLAIGTIQNSGNSYRVYVSTGIEYLYVGDRITVDKNNTEYPKASVIQSVNYETKYITVSEPLTSSNSTKTLYVHGGCSFGQASHTEGIANRAIQSGSHAEGNKTIADGVLSHTEGQGTFAKGDLQHAQGRYNLPDITSAHVVGNGTSDTTRSNAHTLDWDGNAWYSGDVYVGSTSGTNKDEGSKKLATEDFVNAAHTAITFERIDEICGIEPVMTLVVDEDGDAVINAGFPDDEGNLTI